MKGLTMTAQEVLSEYGIEKCPECHCCTGDETEFKDFSNKEIAICAQCGFEWWFRIMREDNSWECYNG
jgi:hypothetical protein